MKLAVFDFETTGLDPCESLPLEVGVVVVETTTGKILEEYRSDIYCDPLALATRSAKAALVVNGFTAERAEKGRMQGKVVMDLVALRGRHPDAVFASHNTHFDYRFLIAMYERYSVPVGWSHRCVDLATLGWFFLGTGKSDEIFQKLNIPNVDRHSALGDARLAAKAFVEFQNMLTVMA